jgi:hypothetical protein
VFAATSVVVTLLAAAAWWWSGGGSARPGVSLLPAALHATGPQPTAPSVLSGPGPVSGPAAVAAANDPPDPVGGALDLKRVFDESMASSEPRQRRIAARAFGACVPAFLPADEQTPSPEPLIRALPSDRRAEREAAYWSLYARCQGFLGLGRASLASLQRQLQGDPDAQEPGRRAQEDLLAGRAGRVEALLSQGLAAADPAAVASLSGLAVRLAQERNPDASDAGLTQRARAVDAALPWVACDLGLDCSANSLSALQMCALQGLCEGDVASRIAMRSGDDVADAAEIRQQRSRLLALIRSGRALTTRDLLP